MALATLSIDLVAKIAELQAGMDKAGRLSAKTADDIQRKFAGVRNVFVGLGGVIAGAFAGGAAIQAVRVIIDGLDKLNDAADATGASIGNLSALEDIAARAGEPFEKVTTAVVKLNQALAAAKVGSNQEAALKAIGLSAEELRKQDPAQALLSVSLALAGFEDNGAKARIASVLLGRSYAELAPLLKDLAEAGELNATVTKAQADQAEIFNQQMSAFNKNVVDAGRSIATGLLPPLNNLLNAMRQGVQGEGGLFGAISRKLNVDLLRMRLQAAEDAIEETAGAASRAQKALDIQPDSFRSRFAVGEFKKLKKEALDLRLELDKALGFDKGNRRPAKEGGGSLQSRVLTDLPDTPERPDRPARPVRVPVARPAQFSAEAERFLQTLQQQLDKTAELSAVEQTLQRIRKGDLQFTAEITSKRLLDTAAQVDANEAVRKQSEDRIADYLAETKALEQADEAQRNFLASLLRATPTGQLQDVTREIEFLNEQFSAGNIASVDQWAEAIRNATGKLGKDTEVKIEGLSGFADQASRNIQDALGSTITATLKGEFDSIEKLWANMLISLASQAIAADIGKRLLGDGGGGSNIIGIIASLFGFAKGGAFGAGGAPITAFANGGVLTGATPFTFANGRMGVAGEAGPEAIMPLRRGSNGRLGVEMHGGGSSGGTTVINVAAGPTRGEVVSAIQMGMQAMKGEILGMLQARRVI